MAADSPVHTWTDVYISCADEDREWRLNLTKALLERNLWVNTGRELDRRGTREEQVAAQLQRSGALVVLWSPAAVDSLAIRDEIEQFRAIADRRPEERRLIIPVIMALDSTSPAVHSAFRSDEMVGVGAGTYAAGPLVDEHSEWRNAVHHIVTTNLARLTDPSSPLEYAAALPHFSESSCRALAYAWAMLGSERRDAAGLRTAALIGTLRVSVEEKMLPTTGDVVQFIIDRQESRRPPEETFAAAADAVGLRRLPEGKDIPSIATLGGSNVGDLVQDAAWARRQSGAESVHLRHVLATGIHPAVPGGVLTRLGVTLHELVEVWRRSIARSRRDEQWDEILAALLTGAPPSARVHADQWTVHDRLDYALYAKAIAEFIQHPDATPPMVISVQGPWGQGKTSLMRMVQRHLDPGHPDLKTTKAVRDEPPTELTFGELESSLAGQLTSPTDQPGGIRTVWFNAWKYQSSEQIWAGLAHSILSQLPARLLPKERELFWLRLQLRRIDPSAVRRDIYRATLERFLPRLASWISLVFGVVLVAGLAFLAGGLDVLGTAVAGGGVLAAAGAALRAWTAARKEVLKRPLEGAYQRWVRQPDYESRLGYLHLVEEDMIRALDLLTPDDKPVVIFIDDLDRCSPAKIGEVIEAVNLFLAGEYPNCAFVIGIDAEVIAASMEVLHSEIIEKLGDRRGELGWRFMDKFVQLPFVMPRLHPKQRETYLRGLFATRKPEEVSEVLAQADELESQVKSNTLPVDELAERSGDVARKLAAFDPDRARELGEKVVAAAAEAFSDNNPEVVQAIADQLMHLSDNPRTIKRAVNLYRFHRFTAFARQASTVPLDAATPEQIGRWIVVIIRWPHFVRWLQSQRHESGPADQDPAARVLALAASSTTVQEFANQLGDDDIEGSWTSDEELWNFLRAEVDPELKLDLAGPRGLW